MASKTNVLLEYKADSNMTYVYGENLTAEGKVKGERILIREYQGDQVKNLEKWFKDNSVRLFGSVVEFKTSFN